MAIKKTVQKKDLGNSTVLKDLRVNSSKKGFLKNSKAMVKSTTKDSAKADGISANVLDVMGKVKGKITLPSEIFAAKVNKPLMAQAVRVYLANQRLGTSKTKTRGEINASTRKIYRQKGTGRARHGAISAPIFVGGGIAFGPRPRDYSLDFPKKMKRAALFSALTSQFKDNSVLIVENLDSSTGKTKEISKMLNNLKLMNKKSKAVKVLFVTPIKADMVKRASKNISGIMLKQASDLTTYDVLNACRVLFIKDALDALKSTFLKQGGKE